VKRPDVAIALARVVPDTEITLAGGSLGAYTALYERTKFEASRLANTRFLGRTSYQETRELFGRARVFVNTSDVEGFPNTFLQAWASGTPVVSFFDPDGIIAREGLGQRVTSVQEMSTAVRALAHDPERWAAASERCRTYMDRHYAKDRIVDLYAELLERMHRLPAGPRRADAPALTPTSQ
jgi:glycosyltransferase involved in cell wall biosynthesis